VPNAYNFIFEKSPSHRTAFLGKRINVENGTKQEEKVAAHKSSHQAKIDALVSEYTPKNAELLEDAVDEKVREFLYSVSLRTVESTMKDAAEEEKFPRKAGNSATVAEARRKFLMGMVKNRIV